MLGSAAARRRPLLPIGLLLAALLVVLLPASPAAAHAVLQSSTPGHGEVLEAAPAEVRLEFSESVSVSVGYAKVTDVDGETVSTGAPEMSDGDRVVSLPLPGDLPDGGYIASYRLVSADSHPVSGAVAFAVGDADVPQIDSAGTLTAGGDTDPVVAAAYAAARWAGYLGLAALGGVLVIAAIAPTIRTTRRAGLLGWAGFDVLLGATVLTGLLQGPYAAGRGLGSIVDPALLAATIETHLGRMLAIRLILLGIIGVLLWEWRAAERPPRWQLPSALAVLAGIVATYAAAGHAIAGPLPGLSVPIELVHLAAVVAWFGGLIAILVVLRRDAKPDDPEAEEDAGTVDETTDALRRFSRIALVAVVVIVLSGAGQALLRVGDPGALLETTYGRLLIAKVALVLVVIGAAYASRSLIRRRRPDVRRLRASVLVEAVVAVGIIAVAAVLVGTPPARDVYAVAADAAISFDNGYTAQLSVDPGRSGPNDIHLYVFSGAGELVDVDSATVVAENLPAQQGPLEIDLIRVGTGHYLVTGQSLAAPGDWTLTVTLRIGEISELTETTTVEVR